MNRYIAPLLALALGACASAPKRDDFSGRYVANAAESKMLPGEQIPSDFRFEIRDDGQTLETTQTFTSPSGGPIQLHWRGTCDGTTHAVEGTFVPMQMSCRRGKGTLVNDIVTPSGRYQETCRFDSAHRLVCSGMMPVSGGPPQPFSYAFDRIQP